MKSRKSSPLAPEWSYVISVNEVDGDEPSCFEIEADEEEKQCVAKRLRIPAVKLLKSKITITRTSHNSNTFHACGELSAHVVQECVTTLEEVENQINESFEGWFIDANQAVSFSKAKRDHLKNRVGLDLPLQDESEEPEAIVNGQIDIGEFSVQHLSLLLPLYPHKEGIDPYNSEANTKADAEPSDLRRNPFLALKQWKERHGGS